MSEAFNDFSERLEKEWMAQHEVNDFTNWLLYRTYADAQSAQEKHIKTSGHGDIVEECHIADCYCHAIMGRKKGNMSNKAPALMAIRTRSDITQEMALGLAYDAGLADAQTPELTGVEVLGDGSELAPLSKCSHCGVHDVVVEGAVCLTCAAGSAAPATPEYVWDLRAVPAAPKPSRPYETGLGERLKDPAYAVDYLNAARLESRSAELLALRDVVAAQTSAAPATPRCSFCHKEQAQAKWLIKTPSDYELAYICDECIGVCDQLLAERQSAAPATSNRGEHSACECTSRYCTHHRDVWRHYEDVIAAAPATPEKCRICGKTEEEHRLLVQKCAITHSFCPSAAPTTKPLEATWLAGADWVLRQLSADLAADIRADETYRNRAGARVAAEAERGKDGK
jgi:ClpX C4-type zinc finger